MSENLLNEIASGEVNPDLLIEWLSQDKHISEINKFRCSKVQFLTYFLNFVHEEIPCSTKITEIPQKGVSLETKEQEPIARKRPSPQSTPVKSTSYPPVEKCTISTDNSLNSSTPKVKKTLSNSLLESSYASPVSPLYKKDCSFSSPKYKRNSIEKNSSMCLGDYIINARPLSNKKRHSKNAEEKKRITPTILNSYSPNDGFKQSSNSFNFITNDSSLENQNISRNKLMEERLKIVQKKDCDKTAFASVKLNPAISSSNGEIEFDAKKVVFKENIDRIASVYITILNNKMVLNVTSEIHFIISLLLINSFKDEENTRSNSCKKYFLSINNIVYFAVKCLQSQFDILKHYERSLLRLLLLNQRLCLLAPDFCCRLKEILRNKQDRIMDVLENNHHTNICFNLDTDNRENFPSGVTFHAFRKQRDLFYDILRIWENNHLSPNWSFSIAFSGKIKSLLSLCSEPINFVHLSRLFKAQLVSNCGKSLKEEGLVEEQLPSFSSFPNIDADKLSRLKNRLITKQPSSGLNSPPLFTGYQEFYKDFIVVAANHVFDKHLSDMFISEIVELNETKFMCTGIEQSDADVDAPTKKSYLECVKRLRILAKFLGFIQALPYKSDIAYNETLLATQVKIRQQQLPSLDIKCILEKSVQQNYRVLTIPWITKYLSMLDYVTLRLPYYMSCYRILFSIYKDAFKKKGDFDYNSILMKSCLGWLFELPQFPDLEYFHFCVSNYENQNSQHGSSGVDDINIIDQDILYAFCPYLDEIKKLLTSTSSKSNVTVKHITPVTAVQSFEQVHKKKFEQQLEDSFLNTQPVSMRKTIEFVSERIASACIKHICNEVVPNYKKQASESLKTFLEGWKKEQNVSDGNFNDNQKLALKAIVSKQVQNHLVVLKGNCSKEVTQIMEEKIPISVENLLAIDTLKETTNACVSLTAKMCKDRVRQWMVTQLNTNIFAKDFNMTTQKFLDQNGQNISDKPVFALPPEGNGKTHNDDLKSAADILEQIRVS
ncbi:unnamed protein product [Acanthoscelides obtectus]|uniref:Codanin-1 C-terminal domain-containing protein n=1 Tax=Acanthoscelides obtectus TaxID=200917 RepID=A0A9P0KQU0_ACAOB|nr:unnamed protein product [Acanthoscelides obtectus]CAK1660737.1 Codanin-1 [Acanthoscelides obtectus]